MKEYFKIFEQTERDYPTSAGSHLGSTKLGDETAWRTYDAKRRYRQSLVEIKDDLAFHATVEQLVMLEFDDRVRTRRAGGAAIRLQNGEAPDVPLLLRTPSKVLVEKEARRENIRAWFVTRELVHGERRYGRLLARGVTASLAAASSRKGVPPVPPLPNDVELPRLTFESPSLRGHRRAGSMSEDIRPTPSRLRRPRASGDWHDGPTGSALATPKSSRRSLPSTPQSSAPLDILLKRLPKLHALSTALSERFEHDPSPYGVAEGFLSMEADIAREISGWASDVGEVVTSGVGVMIDKSLEQQKTKKRRASEGLHMDQGGVDDLAESESEERLAFADIIIVPIQRASRYRLLFKELSTKVPTTSRTWHIVDRALEASIRLAAECDRCQSFDLNALRRQEKKGKKARPVSAGPGIVAALGR
ncbi:hypothetical protein IAU60_005263 [Kwoniella sp. DSM 27419]